MSLEFLCILPDFPGAQSKRLEVRPRHIEAAKVNNHKNVMPFGGAMLESHVADGEIPNFKGSVLLVRANSKQECEDILSKDIYVASQVWDMSKAQIIAFKTALTPAQ